jgi:hypothetical protein
VLIFGAAGRFGLPPSPSGPVLFPMLSPSASVERSAAALITLFVSCVCLSHHVAAMQWAMEFQVGLTKFDWPAELSTYPQVGGPMLRVSLARAP